MRVAVIGRTPWLLDCAREIICKGHDIPLIWTCGEEEYFDANLREYEDFAKECGATFVHDINIQEIDNLNQIRAADCDIAISINWITILGNEILSIFPHGILNAHAGDLPRYRGNACPNWAILNNEPHIGLCIHRMAPELDAGPVYLRRHFPLSNDTYINDVYDWLREMTPSMFAETIDHISKGTLKAEGQDETGLLPLRCYPRRPEDGRIDWTNSAIQILRLIRASSRPFAGAFSKLEGERLVTIWRAQAITHPLDFRAVPGQICFALDGDPVIACGDGMIRLQEIELEGTLENARSKMSLLSSQRNRLFD